MSLVKNLIRPEPDYHPSRFPHNLFPAEEYPFAAGCAASCVWYGMAAYTTHSGCGGDYAEEEARYKNARLKMSAQGEEGGSDFACDACGNRLGDPMDFQGCL